VTKFVAVQVLDPVDTYLTVCCIINWSCKTCLCNFVQAQNGNLATLPKDVS